MGLVLQYSNFGAKLYKLGIALTHRMKTKSVFLLLLFEACCYVLVT